MSNLFHGLHTYPVGAGRAIGMDRTAITSVGDRLPDVLLMFYMSGMLDSRPQLLPQPRESTLFEEWMGMTESEWDALGDVDEQEHG